MVANADFEHRWQAAKKNLTQPWLTCHEAANKSRDFSTTTEARQLQPMGDNSSQFLRHVHSLGRYSVLNNVRIAMGKNHEVTGVESYALPIHQPGKGVPFRKQVVNDYVSRACCQIGRNRAGGRRTKTPRRGKFPVVEHGSLELHHLQH